MTLAGVGAALLVILNNDSPVLLAVSVAMAVARGVSARSRSRVATAITAFVMAFAPWGFAFIFGAPYLALAAWLLLRTKQVR